MAQPEKKPLLISIELPADCIDNCPTAHKCISDPHEFGIIAMVNSVVEIDPDSDLTYVGKIACPGRSLQETGRILKKLVQVCNIDASCVTYRDNGLVDHRDIADTFNKKRRI